MGKVEEVCRLANSYRQELMTLFILGQYPGVQRDLFLPDELAQLDWVQMIRNANPKMQYEAWEEALWFMIIGTIVAEYGREI